MCKMPCESCAVQFSVFKRKRACSECERNYCSGCLRRGGGTMCAPCRALSTRPLSRTAITHLKVRDLQCFLHRQNVSTRGCVEKEELVSLCVSHVNSASYRRRGGRTAGASAFSSLRGFTTNINEFINSAFDLRHSPRPPPPPTTNSHSFCYNNAHAHSPSPTAPPVYATERFTTTPGGERDVFVPVPAPDQDGAVSPDGAARRETADCYEVEDLDDAGWEFVTRPADPLPNDSDVLLSANENAVSERAADVSRELAAPRTPQRAASELELHRSESAATDTDTASLQDEPLMDSEEDRPKQITLENVKRASDLEGLNVKQLKELLTRNRVEYRGCLERTDLLERAKMLWTDHAKFRDELDNLPIEECCKICMAAPLECVLLECGHIAACTACSKQLAECPICRQYVVRAVRFFRS